LVSRCANPQCDAHFRYLHEGRVYRFASQTRCHDEWKCDGPHIHYFWLCEACELEFRLGYSNQEGVYLEPIRGGARVAVEPPESAQPDFRGEHTVV
jgi:hypothetical protein